MTDIPPSRLLPDAMSYTDTGCVAPSRSAGPPSRCCSGLPPAVAQTLRRGRRWTPPLRLGRSASEAASAAARLAEALARRRAIAIIVVVALAVRIFMMLGSDAILWADSDVFIESFGAIRSGRLLDHDPHRTLLYPYFLTAFLIWSGEPPMDQIIVGAQHLLGIVTAVCLYVACRPVFGTRVALAGALMLAVHTTQLFYEVSILSEVLFGCVLAISLVPMTSFVANPTRAGP